MRNVNNPSDETGPKPVCTCVAHHILLSFDQYKVFIVNVSDNACDNDLNSWHPFCLSQINQLFATNELTEVRTAWSWETWIKLKKEEWWNSGQGTDKDFIINFVMLCPV